MEAKRKAYVQIHAAVLLFGITAILGKLIQLGELALVWNRLWIGCVGLIAIPGVLRALIQLKRSEIMRFAGIGVLICIHWVTFYGSIKLGNNASITLACLATSTLFTSILEPLITGSKFEPAEVFIGGLVIIGIYFITGVGAFYYDAILVGLISAFFAALFSVLNKRYIRQHRALSVSLLELFSGFVLLGVYLLITKWNTPDFELFPKGNDWTYLIILGLFCTSLAFVLALEALKELSAFISNLSINLEPVYGILLAALIFKENQSLNLEFYLGTGIILLSVFLHPYIVKVSKAMLKGRIIGD